MRLVCLISFACVVSLITGCRGNRSDVPKAVAPAGVTAKGAKSVRSIPSKVEILPAGQMNGKVASVQTRLRFVVLDFYLSPMPESGTRLNVYRGGQKVAELKVSSQRTSSNAVADILAGEPRVGDDVRPD